MGVSYLLECQKCRKALDLLMELGVNEAEDLLEPGWYFDFDELLNIKEFKRWIDKHSKHGPIAFTGR